MENKRCIWTTKIGEKGQIVIPKEAREMFGFNTGDTLLLLGDSERGIAIVRKDDYANFAQALFDAVNKENKQ